MSPSSKTLEIDAASIRRLVDEFYARVRVDPGLGPIFESVVARSPGGWEPHLQRMTSFWESVVLGAGTYRRNPMKAHMDLPPFDLALFDRWLELFSETTKEVFEPAAAAIFENRSRFMATNLRKALELKRG